jgi:hypothetical protein
MKSDSDKWNKKIKKPSDRKEYGSYESIPARGGIAEAVPPLQNIHPYTGGACASAYSFINVCHFIDSRAYKPQSQAGACTGAAVIDISRCV